VTDQRLLFKFLEVDSAA